MNRTPENGMDPAGGTTVVPLKIPQALLEQAFADSGADSWGLSPKSLALALEVSVKKRFAGNPAAVSQIEAYLFSLHLRDLALASACAEGHSAAWDYFVATFRPYLRSTAAVLLRCSPDQPVACELADSLFADLYGVNEGAERRSLFRYFHGRSSLKTWLRAVLAQRHVDLIRSGRRFTDLESTSGELAQSPAVSTPRPTTSRPTILPRVHSDGAGSPADPRRDELIAAFRRTLEVALGLLDPRDKERLRLYYAAEQTLAEIGRKLGEHESSVSRNLERTRRELRQQVEHALRKGTAGVDGRAATGFSDAQIALCFEYASQESPIDLDKLLPESPTTSRKSESKKP